MVNTENKESLQNVRMGTCNGDEYSSNGQRGPEAGARRGHRSSC